MKSRYTLCVKGTFWNGWPGTRLYPVPAAFAKKYATVEAIIRDRMVLGTATEFASTETHNIVEATV